jgi:hypothetical protein
MKKQKQFQLSGAAKRKVAKIKLDREESFIATLPRFRMALIKNKLRSTLTDSRLSALELVSVECDSLDKMSFSDIIDLLSTAKKQEVPFIELILTVQSTIDIVIALYVT